MEIAAAKPAVDPRRYFESVRTDSVVPEQAPVCLYLETTNRCNLLCTTCPRTYEELEPPADMSWELFCSIVDQIPKLQRAVLHGVGEPMLVKHLPRMVRYLKDRGTYVLFNTNGTVLNEKNGRALIEAELDELRVSFDAANAESYRAIRGRNYFHRILKNVRAFRDMQERDGRAKPRVSAWLTGLRETVEQLPDFVRVAAETGVREVYLQRLVFFDGERHRQGAAGPGALRAALRRGGGLYRPRRGPCQIARHHVQRLGRRQRARHEPKAQRQWLAMVAVPPAVDRHVLHRQRPRAALLHRAVLAARLRELHARRRHPTELARNLDRRSLPRFPQGAAVGQAAGRLRRLRLALESVAMPREAGGVAVVIPTLNESESIAAVVAGLPRRCRRPRDRRRRRQH